MADDTRDILPLFPLQVVLMPGAELQLRIFEPRYLKLASDCIRTGAGFGIPPIRSGTEAGTPATPCAVGTLATIVEWGRGKDGLLSLVVEGSRRFHLHDWAPETSGLLLGTVSWFDPEPPSPLGARHAYLAQLLQSLAEVVPIPPPRHAAQALGDVQRLLYRLAERLPLEPAQQLEILAQASVERQLALIEGHVERLLERGSDRLH